VEDLRVKIGIQKQKGAHVVILFNVRLGLLIEVDNLETILGEGALKSLAKYDEISATDQLKTQRKENLHANAKQVITIIKKIIFTYFYSGNWTEQHCGTSRLMLKSTLVMVSKVASYPKECNKKRKRKWLQRNRHFSTGP
jgi:hypothetical protein